MLCNPWRIPRKDKDCRKQDSTIPTQKEGSKRTERQRFSWRLSRRNWTHWTLALVAAGKCWKEDTNDTVLPAVLKCLQLGKKHDPQPKFETSPARRGRREFRSCMSLLVPATVFCKSIDSIFQFQRSWYIQNWQPAAQHIDARMDIEFGTCRE